MGFRPIQEAGGDKLRRVEIIYAGAATSNADALSGLETVIVTGIVAGIFTLAAVVLGFLGSSRIEARVRRREDQAQYDRLVTEAVSASEANSFLLNGPWRLSPGFRACHSEACVIHAQSQVETASTANSCAVAGVTDQDGQCSSAI